MHEWIVNLTSDVSKNVFLIINTGNGHIYEVLHRWTEHEIAIKLACVRWWSVSRCLRSIGHGRWYVRDLNRNRITDWLLDDSHNRNRSWRGWSTSRCLSRTGSSSKSQTRAPSNYKTFLALNWYFDRSILLLVNKFLILVKMARRHSNLINNTNQNVNIQIESRFIILLEYRKSLH